MCAVVSRVSTAVIRPSPGKLREEKKKWAYGFKGLEFMMVEQGASESSPSKTAGWPGSKQRDREKV